MGDITCIHVFVLHTKYFTHVERYIKAKFTSNVYIVCYQVTSERTLVV